MPNSIKLLSVAVISIDFQGFSICGAAVSLFPTLPLYLTGTCLVYYPMCVCVCVYICVYMYVCVYVCVCICMCVYMYVCIYSMLKQK